MPKNKNFLFIFFKIVLPSFKTINNIYKLIVVGLISSLVKIIFFKKLIIRYHYNSIIIL